MKCQIYESKTKYLYFFCTALKKLLLIPIAVKCEIKIFYFCYILVKQIGQKDTFYIYRNYVR